MIDATKSPSPGGELAATASLAMPRSQCAASPAALDGTVSGSPREAARERPRHRQLAPWTRESVASIIQVEVRVLVRVRGCAATEEAAAFGPGGDPVARARRDQDRVFGADLRALAVDLHLGGALEQVVDLLRR